MEHAEAVKLIKDYGFAVLKHQNNWLGEAYEALLRALLSASIADTAGASERLKGKSCRTGHYDICHAAKQDGVVCPEGECDIDSGVRPIAPRAPSSDTAGAKPVAQWQTKLREPILPECDTWINVSEEGARMTMEKWPHVYEVRALVVAATPASSVADDPTLIELLRNVCRYADSVCGMLRQGGWPGKAEALEARIKAVIDHDAASAPSVADAVREKITRALHYPDCWDTAAYPTLDTAILESMSNFICSTCLDNLVGSTGAPSVADAAGASESLPENIDWTRVMALAEKHGDGWSDAKGWSFHCDDDLFNFAGELAKESGND